MVSSIICVYAYSSLSLTQTKSNNNVSGFEKRPVIFNTRMFSTCCHSSKFDTMVLKFDIQQAE